MTLKHVFVERLLPGSADRVEALGIELRLVMKQRGWIPYNAWRGVAGVDVGEPPLFDVGILNRASGDETYAVFEGDFPDRETLERQLHDMRNDPEVVKILIKAAELADRTQSRSFVFHAWEPGPR